MEKRNNYNTMKYWREILIGVLTLVIVLMATCSPSEKCKEGKPVITTVIDTVLLPQKERVVEIPVPYPVKVDKNDSNTVINTPITPGSDSLYFNKYTQEIDDSLIEGSITLLVDGKLIKNELTYKAKFPKYIREVTTISKTDTLTLKVDKTSLAIGVNFPLTVVNNSPEIYLSLSHRKFIYQVGYNPMFNQPRIGINYKLW